VVVASLALAGATAGLGGAAFASGSPCSGACGVGGNIDGPGTGSGLNGNLGHDTIYCNGHLALWANSGPPAHTTDCQFG
jgi:hypothetical protein